MIPEAASHASRRKHRKLGLGLLCLLVLAGDLSGVVKADVLRALLGAPIRKSVGVSTTFASSLRVEPSIAQIVSRDFQADTTSYPNEATSSYLDLQRAPPEVSKIRDYSNAAPVPIELVQEQRMRRHWQQQQHQSPVSPSAVLGGSTSAPFQLLQPRRAGDKQQVLQSAEVSAINQLQPRHMSRAIEAGSSARGGAPGAAEVHASEAMQVASEQKNLKSMIRGAKNLLSNGFASIEQRAGGFLWLSSNLLAALIPLASLLSLPTFLSTAANASQAAQTNQTRRSSLAEHLTSSLASLADGQQLVSALSAGGKGGIQSRVEYVMGWLERSVEHLPSFPRLHPQECVKRSICEAHHEPSKYGAVGLTLRLLFPASPATANGTDNAPMDNMEYKVINKYRHAAGYGLSRRLDSNSAGEPVCKEKYDDCLVSLLEVGQKLIDFLLR